jgi:hypothetical protein
LDFNGLKAIEYRQLLNASPAPTTSIASSFLDTAPSTATMTVDAPSIVRDYNATTTVGQARKPQLHQRPNSFLSEWRWGWHIRWRPDVCQGGALRALPGSSPTS